MYFRVLEDQGRRIVGYVVPDNVDGHCNIVVRSAGRDVVVFPANELRQDLAGLIAVGRHQSGACGFTLDEALAPGLGDLDDLSLHDLETETLLYRRLQAGHLQKRVLRLESHLYPLWRLDSALNPRFQFTANRIDGHGHETITQFLLPYDVPSVYLSGRIFFERYRSYIEPTFEVVFFMHHPLEELAERLVLLSRIKQDGANVLSPRDSIGLRAAMEFAQSLTFHDERAFVRQFDALDGETARAFANPVTRQLTATEPHEMPRMASVSRALNALASFAVVGLRRAPDAASEALAALVDLSPAELPEIGNLPNVATLAKMLKRTRVADGLLDLDLEVYFHIVDAYKTSATTSAQGRDA
jgi:hypothetical protein